MRYVNYIFSDELVGVSTDRYDNQLWSSCTSRKSHRCRECTEEFEAGATMWRPQDDGMNRSSRVCDGCMTEMVEEFERKNPHIWAHRKERDLPDEQVLEVAELARFAIDYACFDEQLGAHAPRVYMEDGIVRVTDVAIEYILNVLAVLANRVDRKPEGQIAGIVIDDPVSALNLVSIQESNWVDELNFYSLMGIVEDAAEAVREEVGDVEG